MTQRRRTPVEPSFEPSFELRGDMAPLPRSSTMPDRDGLLAPGEAFTPTRPKLSRLLIGREVELRRILQALQEDDAHVVLYSERGRGKTSLANLVVESLRRSETIVARYTCEAETTFDDLMRGLMRDLPSSLLASPVGSYAASYVADDDDDGCVAALPTGTLRPRDIVTMPQRLNCRRLVAVIDEFDRIVDPITRVRLADTIKQLSDRDVPLLFLIVGVSEDLDSILGQHPSIQRAVAAVHLPLFHESEVSELITRSGRAVGLQFPPSVVARITVLARGMPYMMQLLGLRLAQAAKARGDDIVRNADFLQALDQLVLDVAPQVQSLYTGLTLHGQDPDMVLALRRLAAAPQDPYGRLTVHELDDDSAAVDGWSVPAECWQRIKAYQVMRPVSAGSDLFIFLERGLMHHVLLLAIRETSPRSAADSQPSGFESELAEHASLVDGALAFSRVAE